MSPGGATTVAVILSYAIAVLTCTIPSVRALKNINEWHMSECVEFFWISAQLSPSCSRSQQCNCPHDPTIDLPQEQGR